jgi:hypothetical protein
MLLSQSWWGITNPLVFLIAISCIEANKQNIAAVLLFMTSAEWLLSNILMTLYVYSLLLELKTISHLQCTCVLFQLAPCFSPDTLRLKSKVHWLYILHLRLLECFCVKTYWALTGRVGLVNPGAGMFFALGPLSDRVLIAGGLVVVIRTSIQANDIN